MNKSGYTGQRNYDVEGSKGDTNLKKKFYRHNREGYLRNVSSANKYGDDYNGKDWCYYSVWSSHRCGSSNRNDDDSRR